MTPRDDEPITDAELDAFERGSQPFVRGTPEHVSTLASIIVRLARALREAREKNARLRKAAMKLREHLAASMATIMACNHCRRTFTPSVKP